MDHVSIGFYRKCQASVWASGIGEELTIAYGEGVLVASHAAPECFKMFP
jgi:hypothetical protein